MNVFTAAPPVGTLPAWWDRSTGATDPVERMRERRDEEGATLACAGKSSVALGLLHDQYRARKLQSLAAYKTQRAADGGLAQQRRRRVEQGIPVALAASFPRAMHGLTLRSCELGDELGKDRAARSDL